MAKPVAWTLNYEVFEQLFKEMTGIEDAPEVTTLITDDVSSVVCVVMRVEDDTFDELADAMVTSGDFELVPEHNTGEMLN